MKNASIEQKFVHKYRKRSLYEREALLYWATTASLALLQIASIISSYWWFYALAEIKITNSYMATVATLVVQLALEVMKHISWGIVLRDWFGQSNILNFKLMFFAVLLTGLSLFTSIMGAKELAHDPTLLPAIESSYQTKIAAVNEEREAIIARNTWKGKTYIAPKSADNEALQAREAEMQQLRQEARRATQQANEAEASTQITYQLLFGVFDMLFVIGMFYKERFGARVAYEALQNNPDPNSGAIIRSITPTPQSVDTPAAVGFQLGRLPETKTPQEMPQTVKHTPFQPDKLVLTADGFQGTCPQCGNDFLAKSPYKKFCSTSCKNTYHNAKRN